MSTARDALRPVLEAARTAGFLGPGPIEAHLDHALGFAAAAESSLGRQPASFIDLGTGGGVPGLALAFHWSSARGVFVDSGHRRSAFLREAIERIGVGDRIGVVEGRAEALGRDTTYREAFEVATARSFAGPAVTAEIAAGLVAVGGVLVVSEPPEPDPQRWLPPALLEIGFGPPQAVVQGGAHYAVLTKLAPAAERFPRSVGRPGKRPLW
ncbi:MAG: rRNA (guanine527-N7)-methyltransferase [Actinomycetota bacterium]|nr:rRNA (guanine527-N7)-methyltransferase [Actinomycetota bacterium]